MVDATSPIADAGARTEPPALSEPEVALLDAITRGRWAWASQIYLVASGHEPSTMASLVRRGWLVLWTTPDDPACNTSRRTCPCGLVVTLTPWAAEEQSVEIIEEGTAERPRWTRIRYDERGKRTEKGKPPIHAFAYELRLPETIPDPTPGPEFMVDEESGEEIRAFAGGQEPPKAEAGAPPLKGGIGGGTWSPGVPVLKDKKLKGKR